MLVLDASALAMMLLRETGWERVFALLAEEEPIAPDLLVAETANALWRRVRLGHRTPEEARALMAGAMAPILRLYPMAPLRAQALDLAMRRDHPAYDCFYVALAVREAVPLVTADRRLAERLADEVEMRLLA
ncbi:MAG: type II toxin-antitoxin system VapC family toxin [Acetobacteraceae bacterium]|nr:type II toxin-antitoxin system VapC family toxin [Acetobacteraceae bacterium]